MNSTLPHPEENTVTLRERIALWRTLVDQCRRKPGRKRVHELRVVTLRLQAEVENEVAELLRASHQAQAMLRFGRQAEKLRRALGPVRELDVWVAKLEKLRGSMNKGPGYLPRTTRATIRQTEQLEERLKKERRRAAEKLAASINKRRDVLLRSAEEVDEASRDHFESDPRAAQPILQQFGEIVRGFPEFTEANLHDFRKGIKKIRYLAEIHQGGDPACGPIAVQIKKAQAAIGEWHDWWALAHKISAHQKAKDSALADLLDSLARETFEAAVTACHAVIGRLYRDPAPAGARKPPVGIEEHLPASAERKLA